MKRNLSAIALGLVLAYAAAPVMAQTTATIMQNEAASSNNAYIDQTALLTQISVATIEQSGSGNFAGVPAVFNSVYGTVSSASGTGGIKQSGSNNQALVQQPGNGNTAYVEQSGTNNQARTYQAGSNDRALVYQSANNTGANPNQAVIWQALGNSSGFLATVTQSGTATNNHAGIYQH
jgi:hypothetical protein